MPAGFPPVASYRVQFKRHPTLESQLLSRGPSKSVWFVRSVWSGKTLSDSHRHHHVRADPVARLWAATLLRTAVAKLPLRPFYSHAHAWVDDATYTASVHAKQKAVAKDADALLERFSQAGLLSKAERGSVSMVIETEVWDARGDQSAPQPKLEGVTNLRLRAQGAKKR